MKIKIKFKIKQMKLKTIATFTVLGISSIFAQVCEINCISFVLGQGTGCDWMCNYCANALGSSNYYFTDSVCTYQSGGCVGNPQAGVTYTCCSN